MHPIKLLKRSSTPLLSLGFRCVPGNTWVALSSFAAIRGGHSRTLPRPFIICGACDGRRAFLTGTLVLVRACGFVVFFSDGAALFTKRASDYIADKTARS